MPLPITTVALLLLVAPAAAQSWSVADLEKEYRALAKDERITARARRRELARRLGTIQGEDSRDALRFILDKELWSPARYEAMLSLGTVGDLRAIKRLVKDAVRRMSPATRFAIAEALGRSPREDVRTWIRESLLSARNRDLRLAAVKASSRLQDPEAVPFLRKVLAKSAKDLPMQLACIHALRSDPVTVKQAAASRRWELRFAAAKALVAERLDHPLLEKLGSDSVRAVRRAAGGEDPKKIGTAFGLVLTGRSVLFVIDISGSMKALDQPPQRIDIARKGLRKAIGSLGASARFGLMTFSSDIHYWQDEPARANPSSRTDAFDWMYKRLLCRGSTNTFLALMRAIRSAEQYDTVVLITDGVPNGGRLESVEDVLAKMRELNRYGQLRIHTVALTFGRPRAIELRGDQPSPQSPRRTQEFLRLLAEQNGGKTKVIARPFDLR